MAKNRRTGEKITLDKNGLKLYAVGRVMGWASVNVDTINEDVYNEVFGFDLHLKGENEGDMFDLTDEEKEWMKKEFNTINNLLFKRYLKYKN